MVSLKDKNEEEKSPATQQSRFECTDTPASNLRVPLHEIEYLTVYIDISTSIKQR
jgi:hypothetical protein